MLNAFGFRIKIGFLMCLLTNWAGAEGLAHVSGLIGASSVGVVRGTETETNLKLASNLLLIRGASGSTCTGTLIEGCILTAAHCAQAIKEVLIFQGRKPDTSQPPRAFANKATILNDGEGADDVAVLKPDNYLGRGFSLDTISTDPLPKNAKLAEIAGYGISDSRVDLNAISGGKSDELDFGSGTRRFGKVRLMGYEDNPDNTIVRNANFADNGKKLIVTSSIGENGELLAAGGPGDSGGPLWVNGKIYGVLATASYHEKDKKKDGADQADEKDKSDNGIAKRIFGNHYVSTRYQGAWIKQTITDLKCKDVAFQQKTQTPGQTLARLTESLIFPGWPESFSAERYYKILQELSGEDAEKFKVEFRKILKMDPKRTISFKIENFVPFTYRIIDSKASRNWLITIDKNGTATSQAVDP